MTLIILRTLIAIAFAASVIRLFSFLEAYDWKFVPNRLYVEAFQKSVSSALFIAGSLAIPGSLILLIGAIFALLLRNLELTNIVLFIYTFNEVFLIYVSRKIYKANH